MKRLLILSDIDGLAECDWIEKYSQAFGQAFEITLVDSIALAGLDANELSPETIHEKMIREGIKTAADQVVQQYFPFDHMIGFSVGGTILWKAMANSHHPAKLVCISSTRLRFEVSTPGCNILTLYGDKDKFRPPAEWFNEKVLKRKVLQGNHDFYKTEAGINETITELKRFFSI